MSSRIKKYVIKEFVEFVEFVEFMELGSFTKYVPHPVKQKLYKLSTH